MLAGDNKKTCPQKHKPKAGNPQSSNWLKSERNTGWGVELTNLVKARGLKHNARAGGRDGPSDSRTTKWSVRGGVVSRGGGMVGGASVKLGGYTKVSGTRGGGAV